MEIVQSEKGPLYTSIVR